MDTNTSKNYHKHRSGSTGAPDKLTKQPDEITVCNLEVVLMPQGEIICKGKTVGWFRNFKEHLTKKEPDGGKSQKG